MAVFGRVLVGPFRQRAAWLRDQVELRRKRSDCTCGAGVQSITDVHCVGLWEAPVCIGSSAEQLASAGRRS